MVHIKVDLPLTLKQQETLLYENFYDVSFLGSLYRIEFLLQHYIEIHFDYYTGPVIMA